MTQEAWLMFHNGHLGIVGAVITTGVLGPDSFM